MRDRIAAFIDPASEIDESTILTEYLHYLDIAMPNQELTHRETIHLILESDHPHGKALERYIYLSPNLHEFMYAISGVNGKLELTHRAVIYILRDWMLRSGSDSQEFLDLKNLAGSNLEDLVRMVTAAAEIADLYTTLSQYGIDLPVDMGTVEIYDFLIEQMRSYLFDNE